MRIGFLGGTFDPIHYGHLQLAEAARTQLKLDRIYFVLSPRNPHKEDQQKTPASVRLRLLRAALKGKPHFKPGLWELRRKGPSYTVDTLRAYKRAHPTHQLFFIMGSDAARSLYTWKRPREIMSLARIVVGRRPGTPTGRGDMYLVLKGVFPAISSTKIRLGKLAGAVPKSVAVEIRKHGLYR